MNALSLVPPNLRGLTSVEKLAERADRNAKAASNARAALRKAPGTIRQTVGMQSGAALAGAISAAAPMVGPVPTAAAVGIGLVAAGVALDQPDMVNAGNGALAVVTGEYIRAKVESWRAKQTVAKAA